MIIRSLEFNDLQERVRWMNDRRVNSTLNIQLPVTLDSTQKWYERVRLNPKRNDFTFEENGQIIAMGGFTDIDASVQKAELYIFVNPDIQGKGFGTKAVKLMCDYGFTKLKLNKIYLHTNTDNLPAKRLYEKIGFVLEGCMSQEVLNNGEIKGRFYFGLYNHANNPSYYKHSTITKNESSSFFLCQNIEINDLTLKIVRDDLFPVVGGGNKGRKAVEYEKELKRLGCNALVTTGGIQSNHNRAMALLAAKNGWKCHLVYHGRKERFESEKGNALLVRQTLATTEFVNANQISTAMDAAMIRYKKQGLNPYYVTGGGHDIPGGIAYIKAVQQLYDYAILNNYKPDYIFHASGTGSTQAGILVGLNKVGWSDVKVIGISVARQQERGREVITEFANRLSNHLELDTDFSAHIHFNTDYLYGGYENYTEEMEAFLNDVTQTTGIIFDTTYSGKAFYGMMDIIRSKRLEGNILFWHTGGLMNIMK